MTVYPQLLEQIAAWKKKKTIAQDPYHEGQATTGQMKPWLSDETNKDRLGMPGAQFR